MRRHVCNATTSLSKSDDQPKDDGSIGTASPSIIVGQTSYPKLQPHECERMQSLSMIMEQIFPDEQSLSPLIMSMSPVRVLDATNLQVVGYLRKIIKFCKQMKSFCNLNPDDQRAMLKEFFHVFVLVRQAFAYDANVDRFPIYANENATAAVYIDLDLLERSEIPNLADSFRIFYFRLQHLMENDFHIRDIITALMLFTPRLKPPMIQLQNHAYIDHQNGIYRRLLQHYMTQLYGKSVGEIKFTRILQFLHSNIDEIKNLIWQILIREPLSQIEEALVEIHDL
ncbi:hypothetical protein RDWZM_002459 [Blomia tropicalis]|uniref:NR LBD domain-containing protein n=1 Tax=Blomia tropicalis TaxID=40697 RepID=A0A9Q0RRK3_BLOTA|nr:hypothetical protein RDWZM_002459 [Blomia tropicalis]